MHPEASPTDLSSFSSCLLQTEHSQQTLDLSASNCQAFELDFNNLPSAKQLAVITSWDTTFLDAAFAFNQMKSDIVSDI